MKTLFAAMWAALMRRIGRAPAPSPGPVAQPQPQPPAGSGPPVPVQPPKPPVPAPPPASVPAPSQPAASGGLLLLIAEAPAPGNQNVTPAVYTWDGTTKRLLANDAYTPNWTLDGRVIFTRGGQIWVMDETGGNLQQISNLDPSIKPLAPTMAKDGSLVFMTMNPGSSSSNSDIYTLRGSALRKMAVGSQPFIAPSGDWFVFTLETVSEAGDKEPFHRQIWRMNTDGTGLKQLTFLGNPDYPDANAAVIYGTQVAIFWGAETVSTTQDAASFGHRNVAIIPADGGAPKLVTSYPPIGQTGGRVADNPAWHPDGTKLIFDIGGPGIGGTWIVDLDGSNAKEFYKDSRGAVKVPLKAN